MSIPNIFLLSAFLLIANVSSFSIHMPPRSSVTTLSRKMTEQPTTSTINTKGVTFPVPTEVLSLARVRQAIGISCTLTNERCEDGYLLRYGSKDDMPTLISLLTSDDNIQDPDSLAHDFHLFHSVVVEQQNSKVVGFAMTYWAYSTWEGRYLYANKIVAPNDAVETSLIYALADVAVRLGGQRLVWQHYEDKAPFYNKDLKAETLDGWLTLRMSPEGMDSLVSSSTTESPPPSEDKKMSIMAKLNEAISQALTSSNGNSDEVKLHLATEDDLHHIERLVDGLAVFDKEEGAIHVNGDHYRVDGFQGDAPMFKCVLIENKEDDEICGMAFFYFGYDVEKGRFLYLEDLFIDEPYRGRGYGSLFMTTLAGVAKNVGCTGFVWQALDWSTAALNFYEKIGGQVLDGRLTTRFNGDALRNFVDTRPSNV